jgi:hypothetical protein
LCVGGTKVRGLILCAACLAALLTAGCAKQSPAIARIEGSEPQRISFGDPKTVQQAFTDKMKRCWFASGGLLAGYRYDLTPAILDSGDGQDQMEQVIIRGDGSVFLIQFNAFNENTLISTRSQGLPPQIAAQMKIDVETWIFEREGCSESENLPLKDGPALAQPAPRSSWW